MTDHLERWQIVDQNFITRLKLRQLPIDIQVTNDSIIASADLIKLFTQQLYTRHIDFQARILKQKNLSFYTIGSAGHENNIGVSYVTDIQDPALLHYRSSAFMLQRASKLGSDSFIKQVKDQLRSLLASKYDPVCNGRHKVFGSHELNVPPQTSTIASHLPKALGLALSINQNNILKNSLVYKNTASIINKNSVVLCSFGDASFNHSTAQGAINAAKRLSFENIPLPLIYICEDNNIGISVKTPKDWIESTFNNKNMYYLAADGLHLLDVIEKAKQAVYLARLHKKPVFLHLKTVRLMGHAGSDIEQSYLSVKEIESTEARDPLLFTAALLIKLGYMDYEQILELYEEVRFKVNNYTNEVINEPKLSERKDIISCITPQKAKTKMPRGISNKLRQEVFSKIMPTWIKSRNMAQSINLVLAETLLQFKNTVIFGEDVGTKGGVYSVTTGLQKYFGRKRVFDTILDEQTILGTAIGFSQNGILPIVEIQFLAYLINALDQLRGEAATLPFFSSGVLANPMIIRIAALAYQKGFGGHFHNDNSFACIREIPGVLIAAPSSAKQAVKIWRTLIKQAFIDRRICVFLEPIALYFTKDIHNNSDSLMLSEFPDYEESIALGEITISEYNNTNIDKAKCSCLLIVSYANGHYLSLQAANELRLKHNNVDIRIIDLNWLHPLPLSSLFEYITLLSQYSKIKVLIVDECRKTGSVSEELTTYMYEFLLSKNLLDKYTIHRIVAEDSFIPLGSAANYVLPSVNEIVSKADEILNPRFEKTAIS